MKNAIIWILGLAIAIVAGLSAMGAVSKNKVPSLAITLSPLNGFAVENIAAASIKKTIAGNLGRFPDRPKAATTQAAIRAFLEEPLTPEAVAILAVGKGKETQRKLMNIALLLSRRRPLVTGWMIADSGSSGDIAALLNHYDTILRTSSSAAPAVIPVLARTLNNDRFIVPFANLLRKQPPWADYFWATVVGTPDSLDNAASLRKSLHQPNENDEEYRDADLIRALIDNQQFEQALSLYRLLTEQKKTGLLVANGSFENEPRYPPLDWQLNSTGEYGAAINDGKLELSAIRNSRGLFVRQLVQLPSRTLKIEVIPSAPISDDTQIFLTLSCAQTMKNPPRTIRIPLKRKIEDLRIDNSSSGCSFYWLDIDGRAAENGDGFNIILDSVSIR